MYNNNSAQLCLNCSESIVNRGVSANIASAIGGASQAVDGAGFEAFYQGGMIFHDSFESYAVDLDSPTLFPSGSGNTPTFNRNAGVLDGDNDLYGFGTEK